MDRHHHGTDDDNLWKTVVDHNGQPRRVLREDATLRVPLFQMDSRRFDDVQRSVAATFGDIEKLRAERDEAFEQRQIEDENRWRGDAAKRTCPSCGFDLSKADWTRAGGDGDETDDAARNPHSARFDLDSARAARDAARAARELEDQAAWRKGKY